MISTFDYVRMFVVSESDRSSCVCTYTHVIDHTHTFNQNRFLKTGPNDLNFSAKLVNDEKFQKRESLKVKKDMFCRFMSVIYMLKLFIEIG